MSQFQIGVNAAATRNLAETLGRWGLDEVQRRAEAIVAMLLSDGLAPIVAPEPAPAPRGSGSRSEVREAHMQACRDAIADAQRKARLVADPARQWQLDELGRALIADGMTDVLEQWEWVQTMVGRPLAGGQDLTRDEVNGLIATLRTVPEAVADVADPPVGEEAGEDVPETPGANAGAGGPLPHEDQADNDADVDEHQAAGEAAAAAHEFDTDEPDELVLAGDDDEEQTR